MKKILKNSLVMDEKKKKSLTIDKDTMLTYFFF